MFVDYGKAYSLDVLPHGADVKLKTLAVVDSDFAEVIVWTSQMFALAVNRQCGSRCGDNGKGKSN
jgi:hypothetical protein